MPWTMNGPNRSGPRSSVAQGWWAYSPHLHVGSGAWWGCRRAVHSAFVGLPRSHSSPFNPASRSSPPGPGSTFQRRTPRTLPANRTSGPRTTAGRIARIRVTSIGSGIGTIPSRAVAAASQGRIPQPLLMVLRAVGRGRAFLTSAHGGRSSVATTGVAAPGTPGPARPRARGSRSAGRAQGDEPPAGTNGLASGARMVC